MIPQTTVIVTASNNGGENRLSETQPGIFTMNAQTAAAATDGLAAALTCFKKLRPQTLPNPT